jgi:Transglutaminase elicitor
MVIRNRMSSGVLLTFLLVAGCDDPIASSARSNVEDPCATPGTPGCPPEGEEGNETTEETTDPTPSNYYVTPGERSAQAARKPWSSWWYPHWQDTLFEGKNGDQATLEKYDAFAARINRRTSAAAYERANLYDPRAVSWSGLCDAWAIASVLEVEPTYAIRHGETVFRVGDLKALILKTYEKIPPLTNIGNRFNGEWNDVYADVSPDKLHHVIETELIGKRRAFIIDEDAGPEVWNEPVWKVTTRIERVSGEPNIARVQTWLFLASPHVDDRNFVGTLEDSREYTYDLKGEWEGDRFRVQSGQWTNRSQWDHPDYAIVLPEKIERGSFNSHIDPAVVDLIRKR